MIENQDLTHRNLQKEMYLCLSKQQLMKNDYDHNKLEVEKLYGDKIMAFTEIISKEVGDKLNYIKIYVGRILNDIKETVGEFKVNITRQMNEFFYLPQGRPG